MGILGLLVVMGAVIAPSVQAQEYGVLAGFHQTTAKTDVSGVSIDGKFNFKLGLTMAFELDNDFMFRTGAIYNQRHFESKYSGSSITTTYFFDYLDVPVNFQYNLTETFGVFAGLVAGININERVDVPGSTTRANAEVNGLIPFADAGVSFLFNDMIGFEVYYERGLGKLAKDLKDFSTFGGNFIYLF